MVVAEQHESSSSGSYETHESGTYPPVKPTLTSKAPHQFSVSFFAAIAIVSAFLIICIAVGGSYFITQAEIHAAQAAQVAQGAMFEANLCHTLNTLKADQPPPGDPKSNPSRAYLQELHATLAELAADVACPAIAHLNK